MRGKDGLDWWMTITPWASAEIFSISSVTSNGYSGASGSSGSGSETGVGSICDWSMSLLGGSIGCSWLWSDSDSSARSPNQFGMVARPCASGQDLSWNLCAYVASAQQGRGFLPETL